MIPHNDPLAKALQSARQHLQAGDLRKAASICRQLLKKDHEQADALYLSAIIALRSGQMPKAIELIRQAVIIQPGNPEYWYHIGLGAMALNHTDMAMQAFRRALALKPDYAVVYNDLGVLLEETGAFDEAVDSYQTAVKYKPDFIDAYFNLAGVYGLRGNYKAAIRNYEKALEYNPDDALIYNNMGNMFKEMGDPKTAIEKYRRSIQLQPDSPGGYFNLGVIKKDNGDIEAAIGAFRKVLELNPGYGGAYYELARATRYHDYDESMQSMEELLNRPDSTRELRMYLNFALGKAFEDLAQYETAFNHFSDGNGIKRGTFDYSIEQDRLFFNKIKQVFDREFFNTRKSFGLKRGSPIFIVGMPRSGTTLVEQILASHPQVHGAGEINHFKQVIFSSASQTTTANLADYILGLDQDDIERFGNEYLRRIEPYLQTNNYVTNKLPSNFLYIGMIRLIFPEAKVIHCIRDPIATCLSCYKILFAGMHRYAYDLQELGSYYLAYRDLMAHWQTVLPGFIHVNQYESLIADQENQTRKLLDFCGLSWDERCLHFYQTARPVKTASFEQVRRPVYTTAIAFWKNYEKHLGILKRLFGQP